jgi:hypothetical protein
MVFSESTLPYTPGEGRDYNVIFSRGTVDLASVTVSGTTVHARVNVIFGNGTLRINPQAPVRVRMTSAFGSVDSPNGTSVAFGDTVYTSPSYRDGAPALDVNATAVFGRLAIVP